MQHVAIAAAIFLSGNGPDQVQDAPFTLKLARSLGTEALEQRVLQAALGTTREVAIRRSSPTFNYGREAFQIRFAPAPVATKFAGLCAAEVLVASFGPWPSDFTDETPVRLIELAPRRRFAIDPAALARKQPPTSAQCDALGPVLRDAGETGRYFEAWNIWGAADAFLAIRSIQRLTETGETPAIGCEEDVFFTLYKNVHLEQLCKDPRKTLRALRWESLSTLSSRSCGDYRYCFTAIFGRPQIEDAVGMMQSMKVHAELTVRDVRFLNGGIEDFGTIESARIVGVTHVD